MEQDEAVTRDLRDRLRAEARRCEATNNAAMARLLDEAADALPAGPTPGYARVETSPGVDAVEVDKGGGQTKVEGVNRDTGEAEWFQG